MLTFLHKKRVSLLYRAATTKYPCFDQDLGDSSGASRIGLTQLQRYNNLPYYKTNRRKKTHHSSPTDSHIKMNICRNTFIIK